MLQWLICICFFSFSLGVVSQPQQRVWVSMSPILTFGNEFASGGTRATSNDNQTGVNVIYPLYSVLDGAPDIRYNGIQFLARKFTWGLHWEYPINKQCHLISGLEVGARGYKLESERSVSSLNSYRNWAIPLLFNRETILSEYWAFHWRIGGSINYAYSQARNDRVFIIQSAPTFYPLLGGGIELGYKSGKNKLAFELACYLGNQNIINHQYIGFDNRSGEKITSSGSHLRASIRYKIKEYPASFLLASKPKKSSPILPTENLANKETKIIAPDLSQRSVKQITPTIVTSTDSIIICVRDDQTIDGDSLWLIWNSQTPIALGLFSTPYCTSFPLHGKTNALSIHAINEGKIKPNTFEISIYDQNKVLKNQLKLKCSLQQSLWLQFIKP